MVTTEYSETAQALIIKLEGNFTGSMFFALKATYEKENIGNKILVDLAKVEHVDSSFMGMLIQMVQSEVNADKFIQIINCNFNILKTFKISHMNKLLNIEHL